MSWEEIYKELDLFKPRMEYLIEAIVKIELSNISRHAKESKLAWLPDVKDVPTKRWLSESAWFNKEGNLCRIQMGVGSESDCFVRRKYCSIQGINYNYSDWEIINNKNLN